MRTDVHDTRILVGGHFLLPNVFAAVVAAGFRHQDLDDTVAAAVVYDDFSPHAHC
jgi:hypothetical protein